MTSRLITVLIPNQAKGSLLYEKHHRASQPRPLASWPFLWDLPDLNLYPYRVRLGQVIPVAFSSVLVGLPGASPLPVTWVSYPFQLLSVLSTPLATPVSVDCSRCHSDSRGHWTERNSTPLEISSPNQEL